MIALFYDTSNTYVLAGVARIDTTPIRKLSPPNFTKRTNVVSDVMSNPTSALGNKYFYVLIVSFLAEELLKS